MKIYYMKLPTTSKEFRDLRKKLKCNDNYKTIDVILKFFRDIVLSKELRLNPNEIKYYYNLCGKPYITTRDDIFFSLSSSKDIIAIAVSHNNIGLDVEYISKINDKNQNLLELLSEEELSNLASSPLEKKTKYFFEILGAKESYLRFTETKLDCNINELTFVSNSNYKSLKYQESEKNLYIQSIDYIGNYIFSICTENFEIFTLEKVLFKDFTSELDEYL